MKGTSNMKRIIRRRLPGLFLFGLLVELILSLSLGTAFGQNCAAPGESFADGKCYAPAPGYDPPLRGVVKQCRQDSDCLANEICEKAGRPSGSLGGCVGGGVHYVPRVYPLTPHPKSQ